MARGKARTVKAKPGTFGDRLFQLRESQKLTLKGLATSIGVTRSYITALEQGKGLPSPEVIRQLARVLGVSPMTLKLLAGQLEFWDLYPVDLQNAPSGFSLSEINEEEEVQLLWFLKHVRSAGIKGLTKITGSTDNTSTLSKL